MPNTAKASSATDWALHDGDRYYLQGLRERLPLIHHADAPAVGEHAKTWMRHALTDVLGSADVADLWLINAADYWVWSCMCYPQADSVKIRAITDETGVWNLADDSGRIRNLMSAEDPDTLTRTAAAMRQVLRGEEPPTGTLAHVQYESMQRLTATMSPSLVRRYREIVSTMYAAWEREAALQPRPSSPGCPTGDPCASLPTLADYLSLRRSSTAAQSCFLLTEYAVGADLGTELATDPDLRIAVAHAQDHLTLGNDLLSFRKEYFSDDVVNAMWILRRDRQLSLQQAVDELCRMVDQAEQDFIDACARVLAGSLGARQDIRDYLVGVSHVMSGSIAHEWRCPRYHGTAGTGWDQYRSGMVTIHPDHDTLTPVHPCMARDS